MKTLALLSLAVLTAGCGSEPEPIKIAPPTPTTPIEDGTSAPPPASTTRTVQFRNPFGDVSYADNLMVDGDFELTGRNGQMPWIAASNQGQRSLEYETGGKCRSGIRCASMAAGTFLLGYLAAPRGAKLFIRTWGKPASGQCTDVKISLLDGNSNALVASSASQTPGPDETGWCRYESVTTFALYRQPILYIQTNGRSLIDDVTALPTTGAKPNVSGPPLSKAEEEQAIRLLALTKNRGKPIFPPRVDPAPRWIDTP